MKIEFALEVDFRGERPGYDYLVQSYGFLGSLFVDSDLSVAVQVALGYQGFLLSARVANGRLLIRTAKFDGFDEKKRSVAASTFISAPTGLALGGELLEICADLALLRHQGDRKSLPPRKLSADTPSVDTVFEGDKRIFSVIKDDSQILADFIDFCVKLRSGSVIVLCAPEDKITDYERMTLQELRLWLIDPCVHLQGSRSARIVSFLDEEVASGEQSTFQQNAPTIVSSGVAVAAGGDTSGGVESFTTRGERGNLESQKPSFVGRNSFEVPVQAVLPPAERQSLADISFNFDSYFSRASIALKSGRRLWRVRKGAWKKLEDILRANHQIWLSLNRIEAGLFRDRLLLIFRIWSAWHLMNIGELVGSDIVEEPENVFQGFQAINALIEFGKWAVTVIPNDVRIPFSEGYLMFSRNAFRLFMEQAMEEASWSRPSPGPVFWTPPT